VRVAALTAVTALVAWEHPAYTDRAVTGYRELVQRFEDRPGIQVVLVCSDSQGDGALVSEFRLQQPSHACCVLRADKVLANATWMGQRYRLLPDMDRPEKIDAYLRQQPVHFLILDEWGKDSGAHYDLLQELVTKHPERYTPMQPVSIRRLFGDRIEERPAWVYQVVATQGIRPDVVEVRIPGLPLGEVIRVQAGDGPP
jgi:hypothetical protein